MGRLWLEEEGQTLVEYGLLTALAVLATLTILVVFGRKIRDLFAGVSSAIRTTAG